MTTPSLWPHGPLLSRVVAAVLGGYALASAAAGCAAALLPLPRVEAALVGMQASFVVHATAVVWVFAARSARRAWCGLLLPAALLAAAAGLLGRAVP